MSTNQDDIAVLTAQIRRYLDAHPAAADTLDGIVSWWLPPPQCAYTVERVECALNLLADAGVVEKLTRSDGHVIYRRAPRHRGRRRSSTGPLNS
jgi:hypothetical protein